MSAFRSTVSQHDVCICKEAIIRIRANCTEHLTGPWTETVLDKRAKTPVLDEEADRGKDRQSQ